MAVTLKVADITAAREHVLYARLPVQKKVVNVLSQVRGHMSKHDLMDLAISILEHGQRSPGAVVALAPQEAEQYVAEINELWGRRHQLQDLVRCALDGREYYLVVIFGHRRFRASELACRLLADEAYAAQFSASPFDGTYLCEIHFGLSVEQAIGLQFSENRYVPIPHHEEVMAASMAWRFMRKRNPFLTLRSFGQKIGRSPEWVRNMLRFTSLPERVQALIVPNGEAQAAPYHLLVQEARLVEAERTHGREVSEAEILTRVLRLILRRTKPAEYAREVSARIEQMQSGQGDLLLTGGEARSLRRAAVPELVRAIHAALGYWRLVEQLRRSGAFGDESPVCVNGEPHSGEFSPQSPMRLALKNTDVLLELLPSLIAFAKREKRYRRKLERAFNELEPARAVFAALSEV